eukprot:Opistho-2@88379
MAPIGDVVVVFQSARQSKVAYFARSVGIHQHIPRRQIPVHEFGAFEDHHSRRNVTCHGNQRRPLQRLLLVLQIVQERSVFHKLKHNRQFTPAHDSAQERHHVRMLQSRHQNGLVNERRSLNQLCRFLECFQCDCARSLRHVHGHPGCRDSLQLRCVVVLQQHTPVHIAKVARSKQVLYGHVVARDLRNALRVHLAQHLVDRLIRPLVSRHLRVPEAHSVPACIRCIVLHNRLKCMTIHIGVAEHVRIPLSSVPSSSPSRTTDAYGLSIFAYPPSSFLTVAYGLSESTRTLVDAYGLMVSGASPAMVAYGFSFFCVSVVMPLAMLSRISSRVA